MVPHGKMPFLDPLVGMIVIQDLQNARFGIARQDILIRIVGIAVSRNQVHEQKAERQQYRHREKEVAPDIPEHHSHRMAKIPEYIHDVFLMPAHRSAQKHLLLNRHALRPAFLHLFCILTKNFSDSSSEPIHRNTDAQKEGTARRNSISPRRALSLFLRAPRAPLLTREALKHFVCFKAHEKSEVPF